jgi:hypothetical protein
MQEKRWRHPYKCETNMEFIMEDRVLEVRDYGKQLMSKERNKNPYWDNAEKNKNINGF